MLHNRTTKKFLQINATKSASAEKAKPITAIAKKLDSNNHPQTQASHSQHSDPPNNNPNRNQNIMLHNRTTKKFLQINAIK